MSESRAELESSLRREIEALVRALVEERYDDLEASGAAGRVRAGELRRAVSEYGRRLVVLPTEGCR